jgi:hypothetical protein
MSCLRKELKHAERIRWEQERDQVLAEKAAAKLARRIERAKVQGWVVVRPRFKTQARTIRGVAFTREELATLAAELVSPREARA